MLPSHHRDVHQSPPRSQSYTSEVGAYGTPSHTASRSNRSVSSSCRVHATCAWEERAGHWAWRGAKWGTEVGLVSNERVQVGDDGRVGGL